ncbi:hypothetical protein RO3G_04417 [Lichtheimia corymbifera JMRC:FSU:9682]|uniref:ubiquitinyl hydrolase 1 n=1 Tax=Lichtheimia corymbifera JMRC:FSU:9682 TaxID=1263082 RepID=A0A068SC75_9FUNG|nr:hypothetical protein RO3G_04417 [Lichtheimia corymbifera JMRC:FSU:9682]
MSHKPSHHHHHRKRFRRFISQRLQQRDTTDSNDDDDTPKPLTKDQQEAIDTLSHYAQQELGLTSLDRHVYNVILEMWSWDMAKAREEVVDYRETERGMLWSLPRQLGYMAGSENDAKTSCYIDSLLFAMFIGLTAFDPLLAHKIPADDEAKQRLLLLLRLFVNKLRKGHLIRTQLVRQLRYALQSNAWVGVDERGRWTQEDASELFMFLTQTFDMPYLPFQRRLFHGAERDKEDDRVTTDRTLALSVPPDMSSTTVEQLLTDHFYNNVVTDIRRQQPNDPEKKKLEEDESVTVAAWQVLELLPFCSSQSEQGYTNMSPGQQQQFVLPLVLNRYQYHVMNGRTTYRKIKTLVDIPQTISFRQFINQNTEDPYCSICKHTTPYLLRLRSAVCHKGDSVHAGHYIAYARTCHDEEVDNNDAWLKLDDMDTRQRVMSLKSYDSARDDLSKDAYMLFYELIKSCRHTDDSKNGGPSVQTVEAVAYPFPEPSSSSSKRHSPSCIIS